MAIAKNEIVVKHGKRVSFMVNTNGTLMDDGLLEFFKKEDFAVTVSLDGPKDINDANRVYPDGKGSYEKTADAIERLKKHHVRFNVRATIDPATSHLPDIVQYFEEAKVPYAYAFTMDFGKDSPYLNQKCQLIQLEWKHWMHAFITLENQTLNKLNY